MIGDGVENGDENITSLNNPKVIPGSRQQDAIKTVRLSQTLHVWSVLDTNKKFPKRDGRYSNQGF